MSVQVFVIDSICMYSHCSVRIRLLCAFNKYFDFNFDTHMSKLTFTYLLRWYYHWKFVVALQISAFNASYRIPNSHQRNISKIQKRNFYELDASPCANNV